MIDILPVDTNRRQKQFLQLPGQLHRNHSNWVSATGAGESALAGFRFHPVREHIESQAFLAVRAGVPVGRIVAIDNHLHRQWHQEPTGFFGFFESVNDPDVALPLFKSARDWLVERQLTTMRGPFNPSATYPCGCQVAGFDRLPTFGMPWNPPFYARLIEDSGLRKVRDLLSFTAHIDMLKNIDPKIARITSQSQQRFGIRLRPFDMAHFERDLRLFYQVYNRTITRQWGALPVSEAEIARAAASFRPVTVGLFTAIAEREGEPIGAVLGFPDLNPLIQRIGSRRAPWGWWHWLQRRNHVERVRIAVAIVLPEYHLWGIGPLMNWYMLKRCLSDRRWKSRLREVEYSWILENNHLSRGTVERGGAQLTTVHRIYEMNI